jgi:hypothetical protein
LVHPSLEGRKEIEVAKNVAESYDQKETARQERNGKLLASLNAAVKWQRENKDVRVKSFKLTNRAGGWLLVVSASVGGQQSVAFRDLSDLNDLPGEGLDVLRNTTWRQDKYAQGNLPGSEK